MRDLSEQEQHEMGRLLRQQWVDAPPVRKRRRRRPAVAVTEARPESAGS